MSEIEDIIGPLYKDLGEYQSDIDSIYNAYKDHPLSHGAYDKCPWFVNHGLSHIKGVLKNIKQILYRFYDISDYHLSSHELYFLLCAAIFHDIGMAYNPNECKANEYCICNTVRKKHGEYSGELLQTSDSFKGLLKDSDIVATIMKYHQTNAPLNNNYKTLLYNQKKKNLYDSIVKEMIYEVHDQKTELLAALLQLADACDVSERRVKPSEIGIKKEHNKWDAKKKIESLNENFNRNNLHFLIEKESNEKKDFEKAIEIVNSCNSLAPDLKTEYVDEIKLVIMIFEQKSHIEKHTLVKDISFNNDHINIKLISDYDENHISDIIKGIIDDIIWEAKLTDTTFLNHLPKDIKLFQYICVYNANNELIDDKIQIFPKSGKLETILKNKSETENNTAWSKFIRLKEAYLTNRQKCDLCNNYVDCESEYSYHCRYIEQIIHEIIEQCEIYLNTDELFAVLWAIWGHELCNAIDHQNSNFDDYKLKLNTFEKICSRREKHLFYKGSEILFAHTDYIFDKKFKTEYKNFELEPVISIYFSSNAYHFDLNMPLLFLLLRYCELIGKTKSYCILDYPQWSLVALQRCWPFDFKQKNIHYPGNIATIILETGSMKGKNLEGKAINEFLFVVLWYELNNMYECAKNNCFESNLELQDYKLKKFDRTPMIHYDMYLQMCTDFASENQLKKIFRYDNVNISEFNEEHIKNTLLEVNGDYLCDIFMKSYINVSSSDNILKTDDLPKNFLHSNNCVYTGLKLNGTSDTSIQINTIIDKLFEKCNNYEDTLYKSLYLYLAIYSNFEYDIDWAYKKVIENTEGGNNVFNKNLSTLQGD